MNEIFSTAYLMGGLGNQMFQIANAYAQALDGNVRCIFSTESETNLQGNNVKYYINNIFKNLKFVEKIPKAKRYIEPNFSYNRKKFKWNESIEFYGYYQSSKNFLEFGDNILNLFSPDNEMVEFLIKKYPNILLKNTVSIHVRLGDYLKFPNVHPTISKQYVDDALKCVPKPSHIFIFSDNKDWVYNNLKFENSTVVDDEDFLEMWLMSLCENNIISNSTFSWWGGYLNKNKNKIIIAPKNWFGSKGPKDFDDIYEDNWIKK